MKKFVLILICNLFFTHCKENKIELKFSKPTTEFSLLDSISFLEIKNNTSSKMLFYIDSSYNYFVQSPKHVRLPYVFNQVITNTELKTNHLLQVTTFQLPKLSKDDEQHYKQRFLFYIDSISNVPKNHWFPEPASYNPKNILILQPNQNINIKTKIWLSGSRYHVFQKMLNYTKYEIKLDPKNRYFIKYEFIQNQKDLIKLLPRYLIDSLQKENIEIFNGVLSTDSIPIQFTHSNVQHK